MNNFKKVGLSALAGSLAMFSANAVEYTVSGDAQAVWSSAEGNEAGAIGSNGKGIGVDTDLYFSASGELDNGWTVSVFTALDLEQSNTATSGGINSSAQMTIGMGSMGTFQFNDISGSAANAIDDVLPKAYEEVWDGTTHGASSHAFGSNTQLGSVDFRTPSFSIGSGVTMSASGTYDPNAGAGPASAGGVAGSQQSGTAVTVKFVSDTGLTIGAGEETVADTGINRGAGTTTVYALYSMGPISVGYQEAYINASSNPVGSSTAGADTESDGYAIAYTAGNMSVSYGVVNEQKQAVGATAALLEVEMSAVQASYTMGAMTLGASLYETDNPEGVTGKYEETELSVSFAF